MDKKNFIIAVSLVAALAIGAALFFLWPRSTVEDKGTGAIYTVSSEDKIEIDSTTRDFINRTGNFGLTMDSEDPAEKGHAVYDFGLAIEGYDYKNLFTTRYKATRIASELMVPEASFYPGTENYDLRMDDDVFGYRSFATEITSLAIPSEGRHQELSRGEEVPSVTVKVDLKSSIADRAPRSIESEEDTVISAKGWTISERTRSVDQTIAVQLVKTEAGWRIYGITGADYPGVLSVFTPTSQEHEKLMAGSSSTSYDYEFTEEDENHEH